MTSEQTLCHVIDGKRILLKMANRGVSEGMWNGPGGKMEPEDRNPEECVVREVLEETGLTVSNLFKHGIITFFFDPEREGDPDVRVHLYSTSDFSGELRDSDAGEVKWFETKSIPFDKMWEDDIYWLDFIFKKRRFDADFHLSKGDNKVVRYSVRFR